MDIETTRSKKSRIDEWFRGAPPSVKFVPLAQLHQLRECEQVAAICYRMRNGKVEFLLVRTGGGRWIFPKGNTEPGLTHAQAAAIEAFEEAGVHGRIEETSFWRYTSHKRNRRNTSRNSSAEIAVNVHLCQVLWLESPQESDRNPTWFTPAKAVRRLGEGRPPGYAGNLEKVISQALKRIRGLMAVTGDETPKVEFIDVRKKEILRRG